MNRSEEMEQQYAALVSEVNEAIRRGVPEPEWRAIGDRAYELRKSIRSVVREEQGLKENEHMYGDHKITFVPLSIWDD